MGLKTFAYDTMGVLLWSRRKRSMLLISCRKMGYIRQRDHLPIVSPLVNTLPPLCVYHLEGGEMRKEKGTSILIRCRQVMIHIQNRSLIVS